MSAECCPIGCKASLFRDGEGIETNMMAVPFRNFLLFDPVLSVLETVDGALLSFSPFRWWEWQIVFVLSKPNVFH